MYLLISSYIHVLIFRFLELQSHHSLNSWLVNIFFLQIWTLHVSLLDQKLIKTDYSSCFRKTWVHPVVSGVFVAQCLFFCCVFDDHCLSNGHCIACPSSVYGFQLSFLVISNLSCLICLNMLLLNLVFFFYLV